MVNKRRQRELARQRHERRQQQLVERRAKRRRRNTIAAIVMAVLILVGTGTWAVVAYAFGGDDNKSTLAVATPTPTAAPTTAAAPTKCAKISPNPPKKGQPAVPDVTGAAPTKLVKKDVKSGTGAVAKTGSTVSVTYIGISCSDGKVFDASYLHGGTPFDVTPLGSAQVIAGWNQGLIGAKAGDRRVIVIPPQLGYGPAGDGPIQPNETLIFIVDVTNVTG